MDSETMFVASNTDLIADSDVESDRVSTLADGVFRTLRHADTGLTGDVAATMEGQLGDEALHTISDDIIVEHIDEVLLLLIAVHNGACGKVLLQDIRRLFGADLSPGTVYPHLKSLADEGVLEVRELARRKVYELSDTETVVSRVDAVVGQLLTFSLVLKAATTECKAPEAQSHRSETNE